MLGSISLKKIELTSHFITERTMRPLPHKVKWMLKRPLLLHSRHIREGGDTQGNWLCSTSQNSITLNYCSSRSKSAALLVERLREKIGILQHNLQMFLDILEPKVQHINNSWGKTDIQLWSQYLGKESVKWPCKTVKKIYIKKYPKHEMVNNLWPIPRPKQFIL